jgi:hypothetical protein
MADDKAKIDWTMLEAASAEPTPAEPTSVAPPSAEPAEPAASPASVAPAPKIVFRCENGHRLVVDAEMAGHRGKCSKCGVAVRIPINRQSPPKSPRVAQTKAVGHREDAAAESPAVAPNTATAAATAAPPAAAAAAAAEPFDARQQADEKDAKEGGQSDLPEDMFSGIEATSDSHVSATEIVDFSQQLSPTDAVPPEPELSVPEGPVNPTASLVARLFQEMEHGGIVEVHIAGGSVILPEFYERRWSAGSHGLFASRAADGTVTLTAVAWDSIQKIIVRQVDGLPDGLFE